MDLKYFKTDNFYKSLQKFFKNLGLDLNTRTDKPFNLKVFLKDLYNPENSDQKIVKNVYFIGTINDSSFTKPISEDSDSIEVNDAKYNTMVLLGLELDIENNKKPSKSTIGYLTRVFNRSFKNLPVTIVFKYGNYISFATCERIEYQRKSIEGEKPGKVSLLKDINIDKPHSGHLRILEQLKIRSEGKSSINSFEKLYKYWQEVLNVSTLNKKFYQELFNWYSWAVKEVEFPDKLTTNKEVNVIRLITRLIFIWFLKEKKYNNKSLIPDEIFDEKYLYEILNYKDQNNSTYYKAILQNLFFATLNTEMDKDKENNRKFVNRQYGVQGFYRYSRFFKDENKALEIFKDIPFLNGGLFENLDKNIGKEDEIRIDCFSDKIDNEKLLKVPDYIFFSEEKEVNISEDSGTKDKSTKKIKVKGLINILNSYKFTISENTPIEEDVALDPELLGKVFENLLASYNPETRSTARKLSGSYYTPREIVNYMVDKSLIYYLKEKFKDKYNKLSEEDIKKIEIELINLFSYEKEKVNFKDDEIDFLLETINDCKIIDPACGSGAFPMGILQKMVHIINKLDPDNQKFKKIQIEKAKKLIEEDIKKAEEINDDKARILAIKELEEKKINIDDIFDNNYLDYARKLYLIENCIYGVDIQPIAIQISKLRFFISLIVDQKIKTDSKNLGINPLPNLETKFVCANTLVEINKGQVQVEYNELEYLRNKLKTVRNKYFNARTTKTKEKYREEDKKIRDEIKSLIGSKSTISKDIEKLADWNPYEQNTSSDFFDMEWMFGIKDPSTSLGQSGFDIVIGNPPYGDLLDKNIKKYIEEYYKYSKPTDISNPFIEKAFNLLKKKGNLLYIITFAITFNKDFSKARVLLYDSFEKSYISSFDRDRCKIFENMSQSVSIMESYNKNVGNNSGIYTSRFFRETPNINNIEFSNSDKFLLPIGSKFYHKHRLPKIGEKINIQILNKLLSNKDKARNYINNNSNSERIWIRTSGNYWYNAFDRKPYQGEAIKEINLDILYLNFFILLMNSTLFYFWFRIYGDGHNMNNDILEEIPFPDNSLIHKYKNKLEELRVSFMEKLFSVFDSQRNRFSTSIIKRDIDLIDLILGKYFYNFSYEEIFYIINYDYQIRGGEKNNLLEEEYINLTF